ncbi:MAG: discoidin domain-containing protein [Pedobacter sp.]|nr:discoidin domain-containing protein [Pedobacter sp.]
MDKQKMLDKFDFWQNKDWDWYKANIPFFESPDAAIDQTYYYRWEMMTAHLIYGSPTTGYTSTEFIDRPWWSGKYGSISCPSGHQLYEFRWLKNKRFAEDFARYWFKTEGAQPRNYTNWLGDAIWQSYKVNFDKDFLLGLKTDLIKNYQGWENDHFVVSEGLFAWDGMHDGMETNINSRQTKDWFSGAPGYRPTLNSYMWADARAITQISVLDGDETNGNIFKQKAEIIKKNFQEKCWDPKRNFFFHRFKNDEEGGIKANTLTYQTGKYAGNEHGREEMGYIPWYFNMPDAGFESAWQYLMNPKYFFSAYGPTTVEKGDPLFNVAKKCCAWSGNAWPFATSQTLKAMANLLKNYKQNYITKNDYFKQLRIFALTHRKNGKPYIAEANDPETGSWAGHDVQGHSEHYFHSGFVDEIITGLVGLAPKATDSIEINPLIPDNWDFFALDDVSYHGHKISIVWDKFGTKYNIGKGLMLLSDGVKIASSPIIKKIIVPLAPKKNLQKDLLVNYAVNNEDDQYFPRAIASFPGIGNNMYQKLNDGQHWYYTTTTNRWSSLYSDNKQDWCGIDFGGKRPITTVKLYFLGDSLIKAPKNYSLQYWDEKTWKPILSGKPQRPELNKATTINFSLINTSKLRVVVNSDAKVGVGISEFEAWGPKKVGLKTNAVSVIANLANKRNAKVTASYTSPYDQLSFINDGLANKTFRWTAFNSPTKTDWIEFSFGKKQVVNTAYLYFFDDKGGVQPPREFSIEYWDGINFKQVEAPQKKPSVPIADINTCSFKGVNTTKLRVVFTHKKEKVYTGLYEIELYNK